MINKNYNMETTNIVKLEVFHKDYNLEKKDNLDELPKQEAVFGIFAIVNDEPANCRYIGEAGNLQLEIRNLFENPPSEGLKKFMQGPWIQYLIYELLDNYSKEECKSISEKWVKKYSPAIDIEGEYPGYYNY
jgi:hypothetical protein